MDNSRSIPNADADSVAAAMALNQYGESIKVFLARGFLDEQSQEFICDTRMFRSFLALRYIAGIHYHDRLPFSLVVNRLSNRLQGDPRAVGVAVAEVSYIVRGSRS